MAIKGYRFWLNGFPLNDFPQESPTFTITGLESGTEYEITATAVDSAGNESELGASLMSTLDYVASDTPLSLDDQTAVDGLVAETMGLAAGALVSVSGPKGDYSKAYGSAYGRTLTLDDKMRYGSVTKMYTALLICRQVDLGHITLDDTLDMYVTGVTDNDTITIKELLMMRSGIKDYLQQDAAVQQAYFLTPTSKFNPIAKIRKYLRWHKPGAVTDYSNSNYILLGMILEWCDANYGTGRDIRTILLEDCCAPLGLTETEWPTTNYMTPPYSRGWATNAAYASVQALGVFGFLAPYFMAGVKTTPTIEFTACSTTWGGAAGALNGTIDDLRRFGEALRDGALISPAMKQLREETYVTYLTYTPAQPYEGPGWMGLGLGVLQWGTWLGWIGNLAGYMAVLFYNYDNGAVIAVAENWMGAPALTLFYKIVYQLYPETIATVAPQKIRFIGNIPAPTGFGDLQVYRVQAHGDQDLVTTIPHKIPFTL